MRNTIAFMLFTVAWVLFMPPLVEVNENQRFTFYVYPFALVLLAVGGQWLWRRIRAKTPTDT